MAFNKKIIILLLFIFLFIDYSYEHGIHSDENHNHLYQKYLEKYITNKIKNLSKLNQANIGAAIISSAPIPIFILIVLFKIKNIVILDIMSSFAAGALIGDVFIHNLPEINESHSHNHVHDKVNNSLYYNLFEKNELFICWGILSLFILEKVISYYGNKNVKIEHNKNKKIHNHGNGHGHNHNNSNIIISLVGDFIHNLTDGMAIGAGFNKNLKLGVSLSLSIFFHEIPHEVGDFSYLLKQNMNITNAIISQLVTALGSFFGVYLSFTFGEQYSDKIISFASGAFLYLAINTIMGDLKKSNSLKHIIMQAIAFVFGVCILDALI
ncbi:Zip-domain-containing protein [Anaeromyces robustus]|uniref:Zip-domain-containing protein n=1 Tax=Anaeromyces robustus TaxID=1754192 RepID=A0A1Y1X6A7_9FUNG|nr:Zip-domain-containing protein [Anaeromyces robustus]|eukprot:ORX81327.1 Zip-domain-containing protein [Anaeromyces robustus]